MVSAACRGCVFVVNRIGTAFAAAGASSLWAKSSGGAATAISAERRWTSEDTRREVNRPNRFIVPSLGVTTDPSLTGRLPIATTPTLTPSRELERSESCHLGSVSYHLTCFDPSVAS